MINTHTRPPKDAKTSLQEFAHGKGWQTPTYTELKREGSEHNPQFFMKVSIDGHGEAVGQGHNKKIAEQYAAKKLLRELEEQYGHRK